jgi:hypothetical protein
VFDWSLKDVASSAEKESADQDLKESSIHIIGVGQKNIKSL